MHRLQANQSAAPLKPNQKRILLSYHLLCFSPIVNCHFFISFYSMCQLNSPEFLSLDALKIIIPSALLRDVLDYARSCASFSCQGKRQKRPRFRHFVISPFRYFAISLFRVLNTPLRSHWRLSVGFGRPWEIWLRDQWLTRSVNRAKRHEVLLPINRNYNKHSRKRKEENLLEKENTTLFARYVKKGLVQAKLCHYSCTARYCPIT